jgi:hypothetical protein
MKGSQSIKLVKNTLKVKIKLKKIFLKGGKTVKIQNIYKTNQNNPVKWYSEFFR